MEEMEGARAEHVAVDAAVRMEPVVAVLEGTGLPAVKGSGFLPEGKNLLEKSAVIHYDI